MPLNTRSTTGWSRNSRKTVANSKMMMMDGKMAPNMAEKAPLVPATLYELMHDDYIGNRKGIFEYVLGGCKDTKLLNVRLFDRPTMRKVYDQQTSKAKNEGVSNCPYCAIGHDANRQRIWKLEEMDADHVAAWSKGGSTDISNCQMLCKTHNRAKGNK